jgi:hypothetical protein
MTVGEVVEALNEAIFLAEESSHRRLAADRRVKDRARVAASAKGAVAPHQERPDGLVLAQAMSCGSNAGYIAPRRSSRISSVSVMVPGWIA